MTTNAIEDILEINTTIVKFREETDCIYDNIPIEVSVWIETKDEAKLRHEWLDWIEYHDYDDFESFDEYVEKFLDSLGINYGYLTPGVTLVL